MAEIRDVHLVRPYCGRRTSGRGRASATTSDARLSACSSPTARRSSAIACHRRRRRLPRSRRRPSSGTGMPPVLFWRPQVALFVNEQTLLPVLMPFAPRLDARVVPGCCCRRLERAWRAPLVRRPRARRDAVQPALRHPGQPRPGPGRDRPIGRAIVAYESRQRSDRPLVDLIQRPRRSARTLCASTPGARYTSCRASWCPLGARHGASSASFRRRSWHPRTSGRAELLDDAGDQVGSNLCAAVRSCQSDCAHGSAPVTAVVTRHEGAGSVPWFTPPARSWRPRSRG